MLHYFPLTLPFLLILFFLFIFLAILIEVGILGYAYQTIGIYRIQRPKPPVKYRRLLKL